MELAKRLEDCINKKAEAELDESMHFDSFTGNYITMGQFTDSEDRYLEVGNCPEKLCYNPLVKIKLDPIPTIDERDDSYLGDFDGVFKGTVYPLTNEEYTEIESMIPENGD